MNDKPIYFWLSFLKEKVYLPALIYFLQRLLHFFFYFWRKSMKTSDVSHTILKWISNKGKIKILKKINAVILTEHHSLIWAKLSWRLLSSALHSLLGKKEAVGEGGCRQKRGKPLWAQQRSGAIRISSNIRHEPRPKYRIRPSLYRFFQ